jgi:hypothetical protein
LQICDNESGDHEYMKNNSTLCDINRTVQSAAMYCIWAALLLADSYAGAVAPPKLLDGDEQRANSATENGTMNPLPDVSLGAPLAKTAFISGVNDYTECDSRQSPLSFAINASSAVADFLRGKGWTATVTNDSAVPWRHWSDTDLTSGWGKDHQNADATDLAYIYAHGARYDIDGDGKIDTYALIPGKKDLNFGSCAVAFGKKTIVKDGATFNLNVANFGDTRNSIMFLDTCFSLQREDFLQGWHKNAYLGKNVVTFGFHGLTRDNSGHITRLKSFLAAGWSSKAGVSWRDKMYVKYADPAFKEECPMVVVRAIDSSTADSIFLNTGLGTIGQNGSGAMIHKIYYKGGCEPVSGSKLPL